MISAAAAPKIHFIAAQTLQRPSCAANRYVMKKAAAPFPAPPPRFRNCARLRARQVIRYVVERRVQLVTDALHRANRRNGDESGDQAVLDGGRALFVTNEFQKLAHGLRSLVPSSDGEPP